MADIEERAERYADEYHFAPDAAVTSRTIWMIMRNAYLAGSAQTQLDYVAYYERRGTK